MAKTQESFRIPRLFNTAFALSLIHISAAFANHALEGFVLFHTENSFRCTSIPPAFQGIHPHKIGSFSHIGLAFLENYAILIVVSDR